MASIMIHIKAPLAAEIWVIVQRPCRFQSTLDRGAGIEAEPTHPEKSGSQQGDGHIIGMHGGSGITLAVAPKTMLPPMR